MPTALAPIIAESTLTCKTVKLPACPRCTGYLVITTARDTHGGRDNEATVYECLNCGALLFPRRPRHA